MRRTTLAILAMACVLGAPSGVQAFCGFYVSGATGALYNNATQVVMMREGTRTVLSMQNNYEGPPEDFAIVVPVPVVLEKENVKVLPQAIFDKVDQMAAPRLVEYWEIDPCPDPEMMGMEAINAIGDGQGFAFGRMGPGRGGGSAAIDYRVVVEAQFEVGEYEIVILSAEDAGGLDGWLRAHEYNIPQGAEPVLRPYVEAGTKFFVAKVDAQKVKFNGNRAVLSPLRFHYDAKDFTLPVRLGLLNSKGHQDVIVHILARKQRYQVANYDNVTIPTNLIVDDEVRDRFAEFYAALFDETLAQNPKAVVTEYSWDASTCDPCPGPTLTGSDFMTLGADVIQPNNVRPTPKQVVQPSQARMNPNVTLGNPTVRGTLNKESIRRVVRAHRRELKDCYGKELIRNKNVAGRIVVGFAISSTGRVAAAVTRHSTINNSAVERCVTAKFRRWRFPEPKESGLVRVIYPLRFKAKPGVWVTPPSQRSSPNRYVLTRLHARYTQDTLGEDLVFEAAPPIVGGRGTPLPEGTLAEKGSRRGSVNNFQGRYAILHPWEGEIACQESVRGRWGGSPDAKGDKTQAARDLAGAPRGKVDLPKLVRQDVPALGLKTRNLVVLPSFFAKTEPPAPAPTPPPAAADESADEAPESEEAPVESGQCGCRISPRRAAFWWPFRR